jgi:predicted ATPase
LLDQLEGLSRRKPILVLFEDAHWADATSLELLDLMADRLGHLPILAIITSRPGFEPTWAGLHNVTALPLGRLEEPQVRGLAERVTKGRRLPSEVMAQIIAKTDGIPLFVEELTKTVLETGILVEDAEGYQLSGPLPVLAVPATLHDSLMARLDRLAAVKEVAQVGAAIGREFSYGLLQTASARDDASLRWALERLEESELVFRRGDPRDAIYTFKHALVQDAAYESLLKSRRQVLHQRIGEALRDRFSTLAETEPEVVAHHFTQAGLTEPAVEWWGKAGDRAMLRSAYNEAIAHLTRGIALTELLTDPASRRRVQLRLQTAYGYALLHGRGFTSPETSAALARARELATSVEDATERLSACYGMFTGSYLRADLAAMRELANVLLTDASSLPGSTEATIANTVAGITHWFQGDYVGARRHFEHAVAAYNRERDRQLASPFGQDPGITAMGFLARVLWPLGEVDKAAYLAEETVSAAKRTDDVPTIIAACSIACLNAIIRSKPDRAAPHAKTLVRLAHEHGLPTGLALGRTYLGWARWCAGDRDGEAEMREGLELMHDLGMCVFVPLIRVELVEAEPKKDRLEAALATLDSQLAEAESSGQHWLDAELNRLRGELLQRSQPPDLTAAEVAFTRAIEIARSQQTRTFELRAALSLAKLYQTIGRTEEARELLGPALVGFAVGPELPEVAEAERLLAEVSGHRADALTASTKPGARPQCT